MSRLSFQCRHRYPGGFVLDVAFETTERVTALFGPSGSGKTSVLSTIAGFLHPASGRIRLGDHDLLDTSRALAMRPERRHIGTVFQDHLLFPHLTVEQNLRYGQRHRRQRRPVDMSRAIEVLELGPLLTRSPRNLSGGERQRVALGRALASGPDLLLMDEPLASLDSPLKSRILAYLERILGEWQIPILYVTHSQAEVRRLAGRVVVLRSGKVVAEGAPEEALSRPEPLAWKNSMGPINVVRLDDVVADRDHAIGRIGDQAVHFPPPETPATAPVFVQFAPADITLSRQDVLGVSARNHLRGRVCQVIGVEQAVFVAIDVGQIIWAEVTPEAAGELRLAPGTEVTCLFKAHSLHVLP